MRETGLFCNNPISVLLYKIFYAEVHCWHDNVKEKCHVSGKNCFLNVTGDGAGVGKGRTIAGIIYENYMRGRKRSLW